MGDEVDDRRRKEPRIAHLHGRQGGCESDSLAEFPRPLAIAKGRDATRQKVIQRAKRLA